MEISVKRMEVIQTPWDRLVIMESSVKRMEVIQTLWDRLVKMEYLLRE